MSAPTVAVLRQAIADQITGTIPATAYQVSAKRLAKPTPPFIVVLRKGPVARVSLGLNLWPFLVRAGVQYTSDQASESNVEDLVYGTYVLSDILEADQTLGGNASAVAVESVSEPQVASRADGVSYLITDWELSVWASAV